MIKYPASLRQQAIKLRKTGLSYNEIRKFVPVAKSTLSLWLKDIKLSSKHRDKLYTKQLKSLSLGPRSQRIRREKEVEQIIIKSKKEVGLPLDRNTLRLLGAALYWAEGTKTKHFSIANSDPHLILFMIKWFKEFFKIAPKELKMSINMYSQQNEADLKKFWSELTGVPLSNFGKSYIKPVNKGFKKNTLYYGTVRVYVPAGTNMRHRTFGWIQAALQEIDPHIQSTQKKWIRLTGVERTPVNFKK